MELGVYSFGTTALDPATQRPVSQAQAMRNLLEAIRLADDVGLDVFGIGEHHTPEMPASAGAVVLGAAASVTERIKLISSVTVLSTDDPVRVYQRFATLDAVSHGRAEITAGRGSSTESFPLFGYDLNDYDRLYAEKLDLLLAIDRGDPVTWEGTVRPPLRGMEVVPRPDAGHLPIWLATGGNPGSSARAGQRGLPVAYGIIGGEAARFAPLADLYRRTAADAGVPAEATRVAVANPGFVADDARAARETWWPAWHRVMRDIGRRRGFAPIPREVYDRDAAPGGALFVGDPDEIAERILALREALGHDRQILQMDVGLLTQRDFLRGIELLGTEVKPRVDAALRG